MINRIFETLEKKYGWRGWWPSTPAGKNTPEYHKPKNYSYSAAEKFEIAVGAILTQNAAWSNVVTALVNLNKLNCFAPEKMLKLDDAKFIEAIRPSGYFNQKLKKLKYLCDFFNKNKWTDLEKKDTLELRAELLGIWGVGRETADSIVLYAFNKPVFVVDAYTKRILHRCSIISGSEDYDDIRILIEKNIPYKINIYKNYHAVIVEHCKQFCKTKPLCAGCALKSVCRFQSI